MSVGEEKSAKLNNNKLFEHDRRANGRPFVTQGTCLCGYSCSHIVYCLLPFDSALRLCLKVQGLASKEEGRPSRWRDGLARSLVHGSTITTEERGSKLLARGALGPFSLGDGSFSPRAPEAVQAERRMA